MRAELSPYALDPFGPSANPSAYVACEASERARALVERSLDEGRVAAVMGPPGHGKTLLLRLLGGREEERARVAYVPFCTLAFDELCTVVLNAIGVSRPGRPRDVLLEVTRDLAPRGGVVILVDDAHAMPESCATALAALYQELAGALRVALAAVQGAAAQRVFRAFGSAIDVVLLAGGLSGRESRRYVEMRLAYGGARPDLVAAFDDATIEALHRASQGVPRRLNQAAEDVVRRSMRSGLPRLRELTGAPASAPRAAPPTVESAVPEERRVEPAAPEPPALVLVPVRAGALPAAQAAPAPPETPRRREPDRVPPPIRAPAPRAPIPLAQTPAAAPEPPEEEDDGRGILLPEIFDRVPGEPAGDYRIVRGAPIAATPPRAEPQARLRARTGVPETVLVATAEPPPMHRRREIPMPSAYADRVPPPGSAPRGLPIRLIGIAGFLLGIACSMTLMLSREYKQPPVLVPNANLPAPTAVAPPPVRPAKPVNPPRAPAPRREAVAPRAPEPMAAPPSASAPVPLSAPAPVPRPRVSVSINATPWAIVSVDGREIGETPLAGVEIEAGRHVFKARMPDGTTRQQTIDMKPGRPTVVFR